LHRIGRRVETAGRLASVGSVRSAKASSEGWRLRLRPNTWREHRTSCTSSMTRHVSRQSSTMPATRSTPARPRASACPRCHPPRLATRLLWSVSQDPTLALHRSRSISTSPHDLHLSHRPPSLCSTRAQHKPTDMVVQA
jgi:hypothetical protein